jgi:hypothetical protein
MQTLRTTVPPKFYDEMYMGEVEPVRSLSGDDLAAWPERASFAIDWSHGHRQSDRVYVVLSNAARAYLQDVLPVRLAVWRERRDYNFVRVARRLLREISI